MVSQQQLQASYHNQIASMATTSCASSALMSSNYPGSKKIMDLGDLVMGKRRVVNVKIQGSQVLPPEHSPNDSNDHRNGEGRRFI